MEVWVAPESTTKSIGGDPAMVTETRIRSAKAS